MKQIRFVLLAALLLGAQSGFAQLYKWVDENGKVHYGDKIPPEYVKRGSVELNKRGLVVKKVDPAPTDEQIKQRQQEAEQLRLDIRLADEQRRKDLALLDSFSSEEEIDRMRDRNLGDIDSVITQARLRMKQLTDRQVALKKQLGNNKPNQFQRDELALLGKQEVAMKAAIAKLNADKAQVVARFEEDKLRYREIKQHGVASARLSAVRSRSKTATPTSMTLNLSDALVTDCAARWRDTVSTVSKPYAVSAQILAREDREEVIVEGRGQSSVNGRTLTMRWVCPLTAERRVDVQETEVRKALASIGAG